VALQGQDSNRVTDALDRQIAHLLVHIAQIGSPEAAMAVRNRFADSRELDLLLVVHAAEAGRTEVLRACLDRLSSPLNEADLNAQLDSDPLDNFGKRLTRTTSRDVWQLLRRHRRSDIVLAAAAKASDLDTFRTVLQEPGLQIWPELGLASHVFGAPLEFYQALLEYNSGYANAPVGPHSDVLGLAVFTNNLPMARLLLEHGAEIRSSNWVSCRSPVQLAKHKRFEEMVSLLLQYGAENVGMKD
jgi:ankyrin repeat protein